LGEPYNSNLTTNLHYDAKNRIKLVFQSGNMLAEYDSDSQNHRFWISTGSQEGNYNMTNYTVDIYSPGGQKIAT
jgi:hypothetical protein